MCAQCATKYWISLEIFLQRQHLVFLVGAAPSRKIYFKKITLKIFPIGIIGKLRNSRTRVYRNEKSSLQSRLLKQEICYN